MTMQFVIAGTDTDVGKTIFAAALVGALDGCYWKPIQSGLDAETDAEVVQRLAAVTADRIHAEVYRLNLPASPHLAAAHDGLTIDAERLVPPGCDRPLIIEAAGGLMVPLTPDTLQIDVFARWQIPVILVARTRLGTINHCLLSMEALLRRNIPVHGVAFVGDSDAAAQRSVVEMGGARSLGRLPNLDPLDPTVLRQAFLANFRLEDFLQ